MFAAPSGPYVIHMCPPMTAKNWKEWKPLLATGNFKSKCLIILKDFLGCTNGDIVIFDLNDGTIQRQLAVHSCTVR
jgi:hypothetical protein